MQVKILGILFAALSMPLVAAAASDASAESYTVMQGSGGTVNVHVQTSVDGVVHSESIHTTVPAQSIHVEIATSTAGGTVDMQVHAGDPRVVLPARPKAPPPPAVNPAASNTASVGSATTTSPFDFVHAILRHLFVWLRWF